MRLGILILALAGICGAQTRIDLTTQVKGVLPPANGGFIPTLDLSGSGAAQNVVGMHFGTTGFTLSSSTPPGVSLLCLGYLTTATLGGIPCGSGSGGGNPTLDNCTPDQSGNSFYSVSTLTNYFYASWQFIFNTATYFNCTVYVPTAQTGATIVLDIAANDATAGHTANFQTCDGVINSGTIDTGALTCAAAQTFTTTTTANNRVSLTFNVQSTLANGSMLVVKILTATSGTPPTANMTVYPHFIL